MGFVVPSGLHRTYGAHHLHFITCSCYRRLPFLGTAFSLLPLNERWFTIYFGQFAIARFDSQKLKVLPLLERDGFDIADAGEGDASPSPAPHPLTEGEEKLSGMRPV